MMHIIMAIFAARLSINCPEFFIFFFSDLFTYYFARNQYPPYLVLIVTTPDNFTCQLLGPSIGASF